VAAGGQLDGVGTVDVLASTATGVVLWSSASNSCNRAAALLPGITSTSRFRSVVLFDADADGDDDALVVSLLPVDGACTFFQNVGNGSFLNRTSTWGLSALLPVSVRSVAVADVDSDGDVDVIVGAVSGVRVLFNRNNTGFSTSFLVLPNSTATGVGQVAVADLDRDGHVDVFATSLSGSPNRLFINRGNGSFTEQGWTRGVGSMVGVTGTSGVSIADVDNDGDYDVLVCASSGALLYTNNGAGSFTSSATASWALSSASASSASASFGDVNEDGFLDVVFDGASTVAAVWQAHDGVASYTAAVGLSGIGSPVFVDVDGDGDVDVPGVGFVNTAPKAANGAAFRVRLLSRNGTATQFGSSVCVGVAAGTSPNSAAAAASSCRLVDGGSAGGQAPYDVHVAVANASAPHALYVWPRGSTAAVRALTLLPADVRGTVLNVTAGPLIASLVLSPSTGVIGAGGLLNITMVSAFRERGLRAYPGRCTVLGQDVSATFREVGTNGTYTVTYVVNTTANVSRWSLELALQDPRFLALPAMPAYEWLLPAARPMLDIVPPETSFVCGPQNDTQFGSVNATVCGVCWDNVAGAVTLLLSANGGAWVSYPAVANTSLAIAVGPFDDRSLPQLRLQCRDTGGNVGGSTALTYRVDLSSPTTRLISKPAVYASSPDAEFEFGW
jgi:hypothetical protein